MAVAPADSRVKVSNFLLILDPAREDSRALHTAVNLAYLYGSRLYLLQEEPATGSRSDDAPSECSLEEEGRMQRLESYVARSGCAYTSLVERGNLAEVLSRVVENYGINVVVLGVHDHDKSAYGHLEELVRSAPSPVLAVGPSVNASSAGFRYCQILCPVDFSEGTSTTVYYAISMAERMQGSVTLLHVITSEKPVPPDDFDSVLSETTVRLRALLPSDEYSRSHVNLVAVFGSLPETIVRAAQELDAGLIVMNVHGRTTLFSSKNTRWSTARSVIFLAACPVMTICERHGHTKEASVIQLSETDVVKPVFS